jgi:RNase adaptor protein for sRNA GlmZ degradation
MFNVIAKVLSVALGVKLRLLFLQAVSSSVLNLYSKCRRLVNLIVTAVVSLVPDIVIFWVSEGVPCTVLN